MKVQKKEGLINTNRAMEIVAQHGISCTRTSLLTWINKYKLGKKIGGRWYVDEQRLRVFLEGKSG
ncbi:MAG: hypothetical protein MUP27_08990 [Desulfobacterales bacterium]|nr:hypothetical protein [Desulfobacterales bacterium]